MYILGISAFYHDSAAVLLKDGTIVSAFEEERFTRKKHDNNFPYRAIEKCLNESNITIAQINAVAYYEKPLLKFERILETFVQTYPRSLAPFVKGIPEWLGEKIKVKDIIKKKLKYNGEIYFIPHHLSHAASTFYPSPYKKAAILTIDGVGEYQTTGLWMGDNTTITPLATLNFPHSLGLLYSTFTAFLDFQVNNDEYKMMGLAAYGKPTYVDKIKKIIDVKPDGSFKLDMRYFAFRESFQMWSSRFENVFGPPKKPEASYIRRHKDLAASIQTVTETIYFNMLRHLHDITKTDNLCISGGVALNSLANGKIYQNTPFKNVYIFGPAGDNAAAVGAALFTWHSLLKKPKRISINHLYFGTEYPNEKIEKILQKRKLNYIKLHTNELIDAAAQSLAKGNVIGWFQGKMEFGARALGSRSILANPKNKQMKERVNEIKIREQFRPFAGSVLQDKVQELFDIPEKNHESPFMNCVFQVKPQARNKIASIVHADNTCRIQTINQKQNSIYYALIKRFAELTGIPCVLNTSFNLKGEPIVDNPEQAIDDFLKTAMDELFIGNFHVVKD